MTRFDLKEPIVGFLMLALLVGSGTFLFQHKPTVRTVDLSPNSQTPRNAFIESLPAEDGPVNLSDKLGEKLADGLLLANPEGPVEQGGIMSIANVNVDVLTNQFLAAHSQKLPTLPEPIVRIKKTSDPKELGSYLVKLQGVLNGEFLDPVSPLLAAEASSDSLNGATLSLLTTEKRLSELEVPEPLANLHKSLLQAVILSQEVGAATAGEDPLKDLVAIEVKVNLALQAAARFQTEFQSLRLVAQGDAPAALSFTDKILGVKSAQAFTVPVIVVGDPYTVANVAVNTASKIQKFLEWGKKLLTEIIKDRLVHKLVQQVITWVQGGGKPQFITNWKSFFRDAANEAAGSVLAKIAPRLCSSFGPLIRVSLLPVNAAPDKVVSCTLDQVVQNVQDFYADFNNGGWIAYGAMLEPRNNYFGAFIETSDLLTVEAWKAKEAASAKAVAAKGFNGAEVCIRKTTYRNWNECMAKLGDRASCDAISTVGYPYESCTEKMQTTPGGVVQAITSEAMMSPLHRIVNAQDVTALTSALINSALSKLIKAGQKGLAGIDPKVDPKDIGAIVDGCRGLPPSERAACEAQACEGLTGTELAECKAKIDEGRAACGIDGLPMIYGSDLRRAIDAFMNDPANADVLDSLAVKRGPAVRAFLSGVAAAFRAQDPSNRGGEALNCGGNLGGDIVMIGRAQDQYAEVYDILSDVCDDEVSCNGTIRQKVNGGSPLEHGEWSRLIPACSDCGLNYTPPASTPGTTFPEPGS